MTFTRLGASGDASPLRAAAKGNEGAVALDQEGTYDRRGGRSAGEHVHVCPIGITACPLDERGSEMSFFIFPKDARWNDDADAVEFSIGIGDYEETARVPRSVLRRSLGRVPTPEQCLEHYQLERVKFERPVGDKLKRRELAEDGNIELTGRDLRSASVPVDQMR